NSGGGGTSGFIYRLPSGGSGWAYLGQVGDFGTGVGIWGGAEISGNRAVFCGYKQLAVWTGDSLKLAPNNYNPDRFYGATLVTLGFNTPD
ncbi:MAG: hypothetical protein H7330_00265, partial [Hymenobacteraceae bacterium]|nr:hypothetical protein [Hymenobacteraceae bacterium]